MPLIATRGAASVQGFGEFAQTTPANYIEDVFSTYLYTGAGSSGQTITNSIDLSTKGGFVWIKNRGSAVSHRLYDTARGVYKELYSDTADAQVDRTGISAGISAFNTTGFSLGPNDYNGTNQSGVNYVAWTFREQAKFFDVVTYTGNGVAGRTVTHNLGSTPGCIMVKRLDASGAWRVYHRSLGATYFLGLNETNAAAQATSIWNDTQPTSSVFSVGSSLNTNANGGTYVAYLFAHDAGGFGLTGSDNVISCGSFTHNGTSTAVNLGYEPQWMIIKRSDDVGAWELYDNMRGFGVGSVLAYLYPNYAFAETTNSRGGVTATGVTWDSGLSAGTYIYIAIRRGPMKTPTDATKVFAPVAYTSSGSNGYTPTISNFVVDMVRVSARTTTETYNGVVSDRFRGNNKTVFTPLTNAENSLADFVIAWDKQNSVGFGTDAAVNGSSTSQILHAFSRAPSFFDVVCYTGNATTNSQTHNLGVIPDLVICKKRSGSAQAWAVYCQPGGTGTAYNGMSLNDNLASASSSSGNFTSTTFDPQNMFTSSGSQRPNSVGETYIAYLFATCAGVSKVGTYTGTGTTLQVNCGFTNGSRFVLIKRTDSTGAWYVWDSARGIVAGNDPYLLLNTSDGEVTSTDYVDTYSAGFEISSTAPAAINANGGTFIFLAIA